MQRLIYYCFQRQYQDQIPRQGAFSDRWANRTRLSTQTPLQCARCPSDGRRNFTQIERVCALILFFFVSRSTTLFAANTDSNGNQSNFFHDFINLIAWVVIPTIVISGICLAIYAWFRRNRSSFSHLFRRKFQPRNPNPNPSPYPPTLHTTGPPIRVPNRSEAIREQVTPSNRQPKTLESISLNDLEQIRQLRAERRIREYYDAIAMIVKRYVSEKYQIKILDMTTGQILQSLPHDLTDTIVDHVGEILRTCDMIQFSRHRPSRSEIDGIYQTTQEFFESQIVIPTSETAPSEETDEIDDDHYQSLM